jgi:hypothetical protein
VKVEVLAFSTYGRIEVIEGMPFNMVEGAQVVVHLFDKQKLTGVVLHADGTSAVIKIGENRWWLERRSRGPLSRWEVRAREESECLPHPDQLIVAPDAIS